MGHSFFTTNVDAKLYEGSIAFSNSISEAPQAYALTAEQAAAYATLNATWVNAYMAACAKGTRSSSDVIAKNGARAAVKAAASKLALIISASPNVTDGQKLQLGISVRKARSPKAAPGKPEQISVSLASIGSLTLTWKCKNPKGAAGTMYEISRCLDGAGDFMYLGRSGSKSFVDGSVPSGTSSVAYRIRAVRSTAVGKATDHTVNFGMSPAQIAFHRAQARRAA